MVATVLIAFNMTQNLWARVSVGLLHTLAHITGLVFAYCMAILFLTLLPVELQTKKHRLSGIFNYVVCHRLYPGRIDIWCIFNFFSQRAGLAMD